METLLTIIIGFMIIGAIYALHAKDLLSALIAQGIVGYGLVICFLQLRAPDLAIVQIVVETITLIIMVAIVLNSTREETKQGKQLINVVVSAIIATFLVYVFTESAGILREFGDHQTRMATYYTEHGAEKTGSANLVTGVLFDFRVYDTLGEATILFTAALGAVTILRARSKKNNAS